MKIQKSTTVKTECNLRFYRNVRHKPHINSYLIYDRQLFISFQNYLQCLRLSEVFYFWCTYHWSTLHQCHVSESLFERGRPVSTVNQRVYHHHLQEENDTFKIPTIANQLSKKKNACLILNLKSNITVEYELLKNVPQILWSSWKKEKLF